MIDVFVSGDPKGQPRPRAFARRIGSTFVARVYDASTAEGWKSQIALALKPWQGAAFTTPMRVSMAFAFARPKSHLTRSGVLTKSAPHAHVGKPDCDNLAKAALDACTCLRLWRDDSQVVALGVRKSWAGVDGSSGMQLTIVEMSDAEAAA